MIDLAGKRDVQVYPLSEGAVTIEFGTVLNEATLSRVNTFDVLLNKKPMPGMYQTVPAYTSLTIFYDPIELMHAALPGKTSFDKARDHLLGLTEESIPGVAQVDAVDAGTPATVTIPVCYSGSLGRDLEFVAGQCQLTTSEVIRLHSEVVYKVYMIGFIPGFAYMGGLNPLLQMPRKANPVKVSPGAVGITGGQTAVYPLETPGGWQIIGQTPVRMFDPGRPRPALLKAGDMVRFEPVSQAGFDKYRRR